MPKGVLNMAMSVRLADANRDGIEISGEYRCWVDGSNQVLDAGELVYILYQQGELVQYETHTEQEALVMCGASKIFKRNWGMQFLYGLYPNQGSHE